MHLNPQTTQASDLRHDIWSLGIAQKETAYLWICGMNGDIEGAEALLSNTLPITLLQVGQGDEVAKEERVTIVIIFQIKAATQASGQAFQETEGAIVVAGAELVKEPLDKFHPQVLIRVFADREGANLPVLLHQGNNLFIGLIEAIINDVPQGMAVQGQKAIPRLPA